LAQKVPVAGAVMVSTPQNVALVDVKKAVDMFARVNVPLLGLVENMAYMINPANGEKMQLFPKGEIDAYADSKGINKLGQIPFNPSVGMACEAGIPIVEANSNGVEAQAFMKIADEIRELLPTT
jgi:ATP-binding protein involved in chromosome partitioning